MFSPRVDACLRLFTQPTQDDSGGQLQYKALVEFDRDEFWKVRLILESSQGTGRRIFAGGSDSDRFWKMGPPIFSVAISAGRVPVASRYVTAAKTF